MNSSDDRFDRVLAIVCAVGIATALTLGGPRVPLPGPTCPKWWPGCGQVSSATEAFTAAVPPESPEPTWPFPWPRPKPQPRPK